MARLADRPASAVEAQRWARMARGNGRGRGRERPTNGLSAGMPNPPNRQNQAAWRGATTGILGVLSGLGLAGGAVAAVLGIVLAPIGWVTFGWGDEMLQGDSVYGLAPGMFLEVFGMAAGVAGAALLVIGVAFVAAGLFGVFGTFRSASGPS